MDEPQAEPVLAVLDPLLRAFEMLAFVARHLHPPDFAELMSSIGTPDEDLKSARANQPEWPERLSGIRGALGAASDAALAAFAGLRAICRAAAMFAASPARSAFCPRGWRRSIRSPASSRP